MSDARFEVPHAVVVPPEGGRSLWQPLPSRGYVTVKLSPQNTPYDDFSAGIQVLPPGCHVREHGHRQNHEIVFIYEGTGTVTIEGETTPLEPGSTVLFCRYARHRIDNTGTVDMKLFWVFAPPGLEDWFNAIGRPRSPAESMPAPFERPANVQEVQERMRFVPPAAQPGGDGRR
jgi:mannose-6-phosphate isomerase-like protein (cupin superfamily)